jgi:Asp/Glu/hydantoin racemase
MTAPRIALVHATPLSMAPIEAAFRAHWPQPVLAHLLDGSLSQDLARDGALTPAMTERFLALGRYVAGCGADAILFTCSAFGPCIEAVARAHAPMPVLKPNEAMIAEALKHGRRIGLVATFAPTFASMRPEFAAAAPHVELVTAHAAGAMEALAAGDAATHDSRIAAAAATLRHCDVIALAQFSMARAREAATAASGRTVLTTPDSAVLALKARLKNHS